MTWVDWVNRIVGLILVACLVVILLFIAATFRGIIVDVSQPVEEPLRTIIQYPFNVSYELLRLIPFFK
jgi:heme A synthase